MNHALIDVLTYPVFVDKHGKPGYVLRSGATATEAATAAVTCGGGKEPTHKWSLRGEGDVVLADITTGDQMTALLKYPKFANPKFAIEPMCFHKQKPVKPTEVTADMRASALADKKPITLTASIPCVTAQHNQLSVQMQLIQEDIIASIPVAMAIHSSMIKHQTPPQRAELAVHVTPAFGYNQTKAMDVGYMDLDVNSDLVTITTPTRDSSGLPWYSSSDEDVVRCYPAGIDIEAYFTFVFRKVKSTGLIKTSGLRMRARQVIIHPMADEFKDIFLGESATTASKRDQYTDSAATTSTTILNDEQTQGELDAIAAAFTATPPPLLPPQQEPVDEEKQQQQQQPPKKRVKISQNAPIVNAPPGLFHDE